MELPRRDVVKGLVCLPIVVLLTPSAAVAAAGQFSGSVVARWADDGRAMTLTEAFEYLDPDGKRWPVPAGTVVDGASIPRFFWTVIGGPFEGKYRNASVIHDFYCQVRTRPHRDVHRVFYSAMLTSGLTDQTSWLMYQAVDRFGPRWNDPKIDPKCEVVDENYDFTACARNAVTPAATFPEAGQREIEDFLGSVEADANPTDISKLRAALREVN